MTETLRALLPAIGYPRRCSVEELNDSENNQQPGDNEPEATPTVSSPSDYSPLKKDE